MTKHRERSMENLFGTRSTRFFWQPSMDGHGCGSSRKKTDPKEVSMVGAVPISRYRAYITAFPGSQDVGVRISDGFYIHYRGSLPPERVSDFLQRVRDAKDNNAFYDIAREFGLEAPVR